MSNAPGYRECLPAIKAFARRVNARLVASGARGYEFEDIVQECGIAYTIAAERWMSETGVPFLAYLRRGMMNQVNVWAKNEIGQSLGASVSLDASLSAEDGSDLHSTVGASQPLQDETLAIKMTRERLMPLMSARTRQFVELYESPPDCLLEEHNALRIKAKTAREQHGYTGGVPVLLSASTVFDFMGANQVERGAIRRELLDWSRKVSQC